ncbi:hypothetical protein C5Y93_22655 [Blastopirellula marina]|uniref:SRPBCC family protein n=2 Tax=Blastopirellula marina TaxID=124 RepID=A0A2S8GGQ8_9BACT|nr:hypothetical protein C5Y93_22655 [Blastopirellula marina]
MKIRPTCDLIWETVMNESAPPAEAPATEEAATGSTAVSRWMRTISVVFVVAIIAVVVLWFVGGRTIHYHAQVRILAPPAKVYPYLTDPDLLKQWMGDVAAITPLDDKGDEVGAKSTVLVDSNGEKLEMVSEIVEITPDKSLKVRLTCDMFVVVSDYQLSESQGATELSLDMAADFHGLARITAPLISSAIQEKLEADFHRLRDDVESAK